MNFTIDKETVLCGSFAKTAGSRGCHVHNLAYRICGLNYIYKSFSVNDIGDAINAMRTLSMRGAGITMPYKIEVIDHLDELDQKASQVGSVNTVVNTSGTLKGFNTDYVAMHHICSEYNNRLRAIILGGGGMARATFHALLDCGFTTEFITRDNWDDIRDVRKSLVVNCTPVDVTVDESNSYIDCKVESEVGARIALLQAAEQFKLYTGVEFPMEEFE